MAKIITITRREFFEISGTAAGLLLTQNVFSSPNSTTKNMLLYVGTYTSSGKSQGIYVYEFDSITGKLNLLHIVKDVVEPSYVAVKYLAVKENRTYLYAVNELLEFEGKKTGTISSFSIDSTGNLIFLNKQSTLGDAPCYVTISENGKFVLVTNYLGGNISVFPIQEGGKLGEAVEMVQHKGTGANKERQEAAHTHSITLSADNRFAYACDLGIDKILIYRFDDQTGKLTPNENQPFYSTKPGAGPRHFTFHQNGKFAFLINELDMTMSSLAFDDKLGTLREIQTVPTLPTGASTRGVSCADIHISPNGNFIYGSNRGHNSIVSYKLDEATGKLEFIEHVSSGGKTPRNFVIDPTGKFLLAANQTSDNIVVFRADERTGKLIDTKNTVSVPVPVCLKFA